MQRARCAIFLLLHARRIGTISSAYVPAKTCLSCAQSIIFSKLPCRRRRGNRRISGRKSPHPVRASSVNNFTSAISCLQTTGIGNFFLDLGDQRRDKSIQIFWRTAGDHAIIDNDSAIHPFSPGIFEIGAQ